MKYFSTFSGIGGFEKGIDQAYEELQSSDNNQCSDEESQQAKSNENLRQVQFQKTVPEVLRDSSWFRSVNQNGHSILSTDTGRERPICVGYSEIDKYAIQVYNKQFKHKNYGDITKIKEEELPDFDLLVGGFPCQSFSMAGERGGFEDTRGTLFFDLARILHAKKPSYFIFENVKGLLNHDKGNTFATILAAITELGYDCQWQVLNSKNFGVPQNRERIYIVGHLRGISRPQVFPIGENGQWNHEKQLPGEETAESWGNGFNVENWGGHPLPKLRKLTPIECERLQGFPDDWTKIGVDIPVHEKPCAKRQVTAIIGKNIGTNECENPQEVCPREEGEGYDKCKTICKQEAHAEIMALKKKPTTDTMYLYGHDHCCDNCLEAMKEQGVTDVKFGLPLIEISDTQRYKMCGNAVTTNVVKEVVKRLLCNIK